MTDRVSFSCVQAVIFPRVYFLYTRVLFAFVPKDDWLSNAFCDELRSCDLLSLLPDTCDVPKFHACFTNMWNYLPGKVCMKRFKRLHGFN